MFASFSAVVSELRKITEEKVLLTFHSLGDTDAVSSAIALSLIFKDCVIFTPDTLTSNVLRILSKLGFEDRIRQGGFPEDVAAVVLLDVNNLEGCGKFRAQLRDFKGKIIAIDHHLPSKDIEDSFIFSNEGYNSSASIVYDLLKAFGRTPNPAMAKLIAMGEISDSAEFKNATPKTFEQLGELFTIASTDYITLMTEMEHISQASERIKTVNDILQSAAFVRGDVLFLYGMVHGHANLAADAAIKMGVDVALFCSVSSQEISFSARMRPTLDKKYGIHLGAIMKGLERIIQGTGGGHPCAAGAYGSDTSKYEAFKDAFMEKIFSSI